ncbi:hypothetical protein [Vibrio cyclitrophicus]|uniref:Recombinase domain-containing protein n=1 Tax=Vibrio tasmaniensis TaxID=212663 RepID=A0A0H3ZLC1_9VIBR|nr:hypothetical protein [Vibrio cyclitrophicus]AKN36855.1 hypothetical protein [Vibrio tasmaniensis]OEF27140.1 hypothetical protein OA9_14830 [Vibrio cyclitrophicus 1F97]
MSDKEINRTEVKRTERIDIRCNKAFKESLREIAVQNNTTIAAVIESVCAEKIKEYFSNTVQIEKPCTHKIEPVKATQNKPTDQAERDELIWEMMQNGMTPTKTAEWLNENGYKPGRGGKFTLASVNSVRKRLKKERQ